VALVGILVGLAASVWGGLALRIHLKARADAEGDVPSAPPWLASVVAMGVGLVYGLGARAVLHTQGMAAALSAMTTAFIVGVPFAMGLLTVFASGRRWSASLAYAALMPWVPTLLGLAVTAVVGLEGAICIVMAAPIFLLSASVGGLVMRAALLRPVPPTHLRAVLAGLCALPLGLMPVEARLSGEERVRTVENVLDIAAPAERVWAEVARVRPISGDELPLRFSHLIGFPRPVEATLSREGVGGVRKASFERGLVFTETVHTWRLHEELAFSIRVDPVPPTALDEHVTIGGPFFDVLDGRYRLEALGPGRVRVHLSSGHRLSTRFNVYAGLWSDLVMSDIQGAILEVIKRRAEAGAPLAVVAP
jgi:hypothetical protein